MATHTKGDKQVNTKTFVNEMLIEGRVDWKLRHNQAVYNWHAFRSNEIVLVTRYDEATDTIVTSGAQREIAILDLAYGITSWAENSGNGSDGLLGLEVLLPLLQAVVFALNGDIGRLDAGWVDRWARSTAAKYDLDMDLNTWREEPK